MVTDEKKLRKRSLAQNSMDETNPAIISDQKTDSEPEETEKPKSSFSSGDAGKSAAKTIASGGSGEDALSSGLMASGNPQAIAAAMAIQVMSARRKRMDAQAQMEYKAEQNRKQRIVDQLALMSQQASNLGL